MYSLGLDPGKTGGIAILDANGRIWHTEGFAKMTKRDIADILESLSSLQERFAMLEQPFFNPHIAFSYGKLMGSFGYLEGLLNGFRIGHELVPPAKWQRAMSCLTKGDKNVSKAAAQRLFPDYKITHQIADAILIAEHCRRTMNQREGVK